MGTTLLTTLLTHGCRHMDLNSTYHRIVRPRRRRSIYSIDPRTLSKTSLFETSLLETPSSKRPSNPPRSFLSHLGGGHPGYPGAFRACKGSWHLAAKGR